MADDPVTPAPGGAGAFEKPNLIYILYLVGIVVPLVPLIGVVMAYLAQGEGPEWAHSHYRFQIRTFWIGMLFSLICLLLTFVFIGFVLIPVILVWFIVRCVKGLNAGAKQQPIGDPGSWLFG